jgi:hypothetical protein
MFLPESVLMILLMAIAVYVAYTKIGCAPEPIEEPDEAIWTR